MVKEPDVFEPWGKGNLGIYWDNDVVSAKDSNYTNGVRFSWISAETSNDDFNHLDQALSKIVGGSDSLSFFQTLAGFESSEETRYQKGAALTQMIFTPRDQNALEPPSGQRPYAGWLGLSYSLHAKNKSTMSSVELAIGIVGPSSQAQAVQDWMHNLQGIYHFKGWDSQIPDELTANIYFTNKRRLSFLEHGDLDGFSSDGHAYIGVALGTFRTDANIGFMTRYGWNLPAEVSDPRLSEHANKQRIFTGSKTTNNAWSSYFILGGQVTGVAHDITLDGPVFREYQTGVEKENFTAEVFAGMSFRIKQLEFGYVHTLKTDSFKTQVDPSSYGSVMVSYSF